MRKRMLQGVWFTVQSAGVFWPGIGLMLLLPVLLSCPIYDVYHVYYEGNNHTAGFPPVDSQVYFPGDTAIVLERPESLKKGDLKFLGWRQSGNGNPLQPGEMIGIGYGDVWLYAWWQDEADYTFYKYADHPDTGGVIITQYFPYDRYSPALVLPDTLDGKTVTAIGEGVFSNLYIDNITLPSQLKAIGNKAFAKTYIKDIVIPDTVKTIGKLAFQDASLETLTLGSGLERIDDYAFDGNYLKVLSLPAGTKFVGEGAFSGNEALAVTIGGAVFLAGDTSMGIHGASFRAKYQASGAKAGVYTYNNGVWTGPYTK
ncbi:MAG: leucine-rich repeat domain-containing protein [Spirochaetaceae bacterium]|jgi:hypothetical protein|nr:leucine-rich repeat domain-containing protein [Spirochaetaceae bacterium]